MHEMKDSGIVGIEGIPNNWEKSPLRALFRFGKGLSITKSDLTDEGVPVISYGQIHAKENSGTTVTDKLLRYVPKEIADNNKDSEAQIGGFIFADTSEDIDGCGNCAYIDRKGIFAGYHSILMTPIHQHSNKFLAYLFKTDAWRFQFRRNLTEVKLYSVSQKELKHAFVVLPSEKEQAAIVSYLDNCCSAIDRTIKAMQDSIEKLKEYKASLITRAVTKGLNPDAEMKDSGVEWIGSIPSTWQVERLRFIGRMQNGISKDSQFFGHGYPFISYKDVYDNPILPLSGSGLVESTKAEQERYSVKSGDIFFTRTSETASEVGFSSVCKQDIPYAVFAGFLIRVRPFNKKLNTNFSAYYFQASHLRPYFAKEMNITTRASLGQNLLKNMPVVLPPLEEQEKVASYLDTECSSIDRLVDKKQKLIDKFTEYRQSLIYHAVTGKNDCRGSEHND